MTTTRSRVTEIAAAFGFDFDVNTVIGGATKPTPEQLFVLSLIEEIASTERQIEERRYWVQSNLDRTMDQVNAVAGRPSSLSAINADEFNALAATLAAQRRMLSEAQRCLFPTPKADAPAAQ